jgi:hypothetical protein
MEENLITLEEGAVMTALYRAEMENVIAPEYKDMGILPICESFDRTAFDSLLALGNCTGVRIYCGMDTNLQIKFVVCGVGENNEDVYIPASPGSQEFKVIDQGMRCPDICPPESELNS